MKETNILLEYFLKQFAKISATIFNIIWLAFLLEKMLGYMIFLKLNVSKILLVRKLYATMWEAPEFETIPL